MRCRRVRSAHENHEIQLFPLGKMGQSLGPETRIIRRCAELCESPLRRSLRPMAIYQGDTPYTGSQPKCKHDVVGIFLERRFMNKRLARIERRSLGYSG